MMGGEALIEVTPKPARRMRARPSRITIEEICEDLGLGRERVTAMLKAKIIPNVKLGRTWLVTKFAYENWKRTCGEASARNKVA